MAHDPQHIKNTASSFLTAAERCFEKRPLPSGQIQAPLVPAVVCAVFGIELSLKAIIAIEKGKATGHDLLKLFIKLTPQSKVSIAAALSLEEWALRQKIGAISSAFVEWRYIYERGSAHIDLEFLQQFAKTTAQLLESLANPAVHTNTAK